MNETLVIVHLSSIDSYVTFYGVEAATRLATDLVEAMLAYNGPVLVMDQQEEDISPEARTLRSDILGVERSLLIFHHDELCDISPWQAGMTALARELRKLNTKRVRLGGLWATHDASSGCVHEVQRQMRARNFACTIDTRLCAFETNDHRVVVV